VPARSPQTYLGHPVTAGVATGPEALELDFVSDALADSPELPYSGNCRRLHAECLAFLPDSLLNVIELRDNTNALGGQRSDFNCGFLPPSSRDAEPSDKN
jgi:hypothetical protein